MKPPKSHTALLLLTQQTAMMCTIDDDLFYMLTKTIWIGGAGASCNITNDDTIMFDIEQRDELVQGSLDNIIDIKKIWTHIII